jgi:hypothetical protein
MMASGGLPVLAKLRVRLEGEWVGLEGVKTRIAPAFQAVAGTLTHLYLGSPMGRPWPGEEGLGYELGLAVGKLRRLKDFYLGLFDDGRAYPAMAQGLTASGGGRPLPLLWQLTVDSDTKANAHLLASLLLPHVRVLNSSFEDDRNALLFACALRQAGYKPIWFTGVAEAIVGTVLAISQCTHAESADAYAFFWTGNLIRSSESSY